VTKSWKSRGAGPRDDSGGAGPVGGCGDGKILRNSLCLAPRRKRVMSEMIFVVILAVVWSKERLHVTQRTLDVISLIPGVRINERDRVIHGAVRVTVRPDILIRSPAITDELWAGFDQVTNNIRQCVDGSVPYRNKKCSTGLAFNTAKHPLALYRVSLMVFSPTKLALIDINGIVWTADPLQAALHVYQQCFSAEHTPVNDRVISEVMFALDFVGRFAA
jgi:hypothetical protein